MSTSTQPRVRHRTATADSLATGCPMAALLEFLTRPWTLHILWLLSRNGPARFGTLRRRVEGISARLLTVRLRSLEAEGFVHRSVVVTGNTREVTYSPTPRTEDMHKVMELLQKLSEDRHYGPGQAMDASVPPESVHAAGSLPA